jgi:hypothetical protein
MTLSVDDLGFDRALVVQPLWCELILRNVKHWEMRTTKTKVRGTIGLIESGTGLIVGKVNLIDSLDALSEREYFLHVDKHKIPRIAGIASKWKYPWVLDSAVKFDSPIPYDHPKGAVIWVKLTNDTLKR